MHLASYSAEKYHLYHFEILGILVLKYLQIFRSVSIKSNAKNTSLLG
jgi:hypothetical protein